MHRNQKGYVEPSSGLPNHGFPVFTGGPHEDIGRIKQDFLRRFQLYMLERNGDAREPSTYKEVWDRQYQLCLLFQQYVCKKGAFSLADRCLRNLEAIYKARTPAQCIAKGPPHSLFDDFTRDIKDAVGPTDKAMYWITALFTVSLQVQSSRDTSASSKTC